MLDWPNYDATRWYASDRGGLAGRALVAAGRSLTGGVESALAATSNPRDRLLLRTLWVTGARLGAVLALRPRDIRPTAVLLPEANRLDAPGKLVQVAGAQVRLTTELRRWVRDQGLAEDEPLFFSRERDANGRRKPIDRARVADRGRGDPPDDG